MIKRLSWFLGGVAAGAVGAGAAKRKVKQKAAELSPVRAARRAGDRLGDAIAHGKEAMRAKEAELRARRDGHAQPLADDLDDGDAVYVDGLPVEPGRVVVLRQVPPTGPRRRARRHARP
jgi:hypothetical protein